MANCHRRDGKEKGKGCKYGTIDERRNYMAVTDQRQKEEEIPLFASKWLLVFSQLSILTHENWGLASSGLLFFPSLSKVFE